MQTLAERIDEALAKQEAQAEQFASRVRLIFLLVLTIVALLNFSSVTLRANILNFSLLIAGYVYGAGIVLLIRRRGYRPEMKYISSCLDILLVYLLLFLYTKIEVPSVALKNYVFLIVFPMLALTAFRYDKILTFTAGALTVVLYILLVLYLYLTNAVAFSHGGYERELFSIDVTYIGQSTKILVLCGYIILLTYLAQYSRELFAKLVTDELSIRNQKELADWELAIASEVQKRFLPGSFPDVTGLELYGEVQQGRYVGGDYFDFIRLTNDRLLVIIADVSGKGVPAALIMAEVRASAHLLASLQISLPEFIQRLNLLLHQSTDKKNFATLFIAEIHTSRNRLTYVNAGHPPPVMYRQGNTNSLKRGTIPLGVQPVLPQLTEHTEEFFSGNLLMAYTDGLLEQTNSKSEQYGEERIREFVRANCNLGAQSLTKKLFQNIKDFAEERPLSDDVGIAVIKNISAPLA